MLSQDLNSKDRQKRYSTVMILEKTSSIMPSNNSVQDSLP